MNKTIILLMLAASGLITGCQNRLVFVTHSSVGLDVSGTAQMPNKVSFSFERYEAAIVPRKTNGEAHSVYGGMDADMTWFSGHSIKQTFATGEAAKIATGGEPEDLKGTSNHSKAPLIFLTATTYGLNLSAGEQSMPPNLLLGYRRTEAAVIPVPDPAQEARSVYADIQINTASTPNQITTNTSTLGGVRIKQSFATGVAANNLAASNPEVRQKLRQAAGIESTRQTLKELKGQTDELVERIKTEVAHLADGKLPQAVAALKDGGVLDATDFPNADKIPADKLRERINKALELKTEDEYSDPTTVQQLKDSHAKLKQIPN